MKSLSRVLVGFALSATLAGIVIAEQDQGAAPPRAKIYWGDEVPPVDGQMVTDLLTVPERTNYTRTTIRCSCTSGSPRSSSRARTCTYCACSRARSGKWRPQSCWRARVWRRRSRPGTPGKPVVFLLGNIHPPESEAAEALLMVARDLATGSAKPSSTTSSS